MEQASLHLKLAEIQQDWRDVVMQALQPLVPAYFNESRDKSTPPAGDQTVAELFTQIDKVIKSCNRTFTSEKSLVIEKNMRKNAQSFNQIEQECFKPFQTKMTATKQVLAHFSAPRSSGTYSSAQAHPSSEAGFRSVDDVNAAFKEYLQRLSKLIGDLALDEKICYDQY